MNLINCKILFYDNNNTPFGARGLPLPHRCHICVRGYELDSFGHVNHAVYVNYLEQSRWMYFKDLGQLDYFAKNGLFFAVTEMNIRYIREAKVFDELIIETTTVMEAPYLVFSHTIRKQNTGEKISEAVVKLILLSHERIPHDVPDIFCLNKFQDNQ